MSALATAAPPSITSAYSAVVWASSSVMSLRISLDMGPPCLVPGAPGVEELDMVRRFFWRGSSESQTEAVQAKSTTPDKASQAKPMGCSPGVRIFHSSRQCPRALKRVIVGQEASGSGSKTGGSVRHRIRGSVYAGIALVVLALIVLTFSAGQIAASDVFVQMNTDGFGSGPDCPEVTCFFSYGNSLYAGTRNPATGGEVWYYDGTSWSRLGAAGFGDPHNVSVTALSSNGSYLYAGTENSTTGCELWMYSGATWSKIGSDGFGHPHNTKVSLVLNTYYVGTENASEGCEIYRINGSNVDLLSAGGMGNPANTCATAAYNYNGVFFGTENAATGCELYRNPGGGTTTFTLIGSGGLGDPGNTRVSSMVVTGQDLNVATRNDATGAEVLKCYYPSPGPWTQVNEDGFGDPANTDCTTLVAWDGLLFGATANAGGFQLWRRSATWARCVSNGGTDVNNVSPTGLISIGNKRYVSTRNDVTGCQVLVDDHPSIQSFSPTGAATGQTIDVSIVGAGTHFVDGVSTADFGTPDIVVNRVEVSDSTHAVANITVLPTCSVYNTRMTVITGEEIPCLPTSYFQIRRPVITSFTPTSGARGQTLDVTIQATQSQFRQGATAVFSGTGVTVNSTTVVNYNVVVASVTFARDAPKVDRDVNVLTGDETCAKKSGFKVRYPVITAVTPSSADQGATVEVRINGQECSFADHQSTVVFSAEGITVNQTRFIDANSVSAYITLDKYASLGVGTVNVLTGSDIPDELPGFVVNHVSSVSEAAPASAAQGETLDVELTGDNTWFEQGLSRATFSGSGITVNSTSVTDQTHAVANITVAADAPVSSRDVNVLSGVDNPRPLAGVFNIRHPEVVGVTPDSAGQGFTIDVEIEARNSRFRDGVSRAVFDPPEGITVNSTSVRFETKVIANITIAPDAAAMKHSVNVVTAGEVPVPLARAFAVRNPRIVSVEPAFIPQGETTEVVITGDDTRFGRSSWAVLSGTGTAIELTSVIDDTHVSARVWVARDAPLGPVDVGVRTEDEADPEVLRRGLTVGEYDQSTASISPAEGEQNQQMDVRITGSGTRFINGKSYVLFQGHGITVNSTTITDAKHAVANITISPDADVGPRDVSVVTEYYATVPLIDGFEVTTGLPRVDSVSPRAAAPGETVVIKGAHFGVPQESSHADFCGTYSSGYSKWARTELRCVVPEGARSGNLRVTTAVGPGNPIYFTINNTRRGDLVRVSPAEGVNIEFEGVTASGQTTSSSRPDPAVGGCTVARGSCREITSNAKFARARVTLPLPASGFTSEQRARLVLMHEENGQWIDRTLERDLSAGTITAETTGFSRFVVAYPLYSSSWYLAEGSTAWGFDCYIAVQNPNDDAVTIQVTFMTKRGPVRARDMWMSARSQLIIHPRDFLGEADFSTMTWTGAGAAHGEGHSSIGVNRPAKTWYFAEGSSAWGFECWLLVQNPNKTAAHCRVTYMLDGGGEKVFSKDVPASSRRTFDMSDDIGNVDASIKVESDVDVIPERAMYRYQRREGHDSIGLTYPSQDFYLPEGSTNWGFTTYVLVQNPGAEPASVQLTYMTSRGPVTMPAFTMPAFSRKTVRVNDELPGADVSTRVHADRPVIAERAMYWGAGTAAGEASHCSVGMTDPHTAFYLPDGRIGGGYETWTLVQNPNECDVDIEITYFKTGQKPVVIARRIPAASRRSYSMASVFGGSARASVMVRSLTRRKKILVERAMYWDSRAAGTDTVGAFSD
jgi:hypothetical protein